MSGRVIHERDAIVRVLDDAAFVPPARRGSGAALELRAAMARFSSADDHPRRRAAVVAQIERIDTDAAAAAAERCTADRLRDADARVVDAVADIAAVVPTLALASCLAAQSRQGAESRGQDDDGLDVVAAVAAMVGVIGRGEPPTAGADDAVAALVGRFGVEGASMLYQNRDATAALIAVRLAAGDRPPAPAVPRTKRVGADGTEITLEIGAAGLPFGSGPHRCPGEELAEALARGVVRAVALAGLVPDLAGAEYDADGRPTRLPLTRRRSQT